VIFSKLGHFLPRERALLWIRLFGNRINSSRWREGEVSDEVRPSLPLGQLHRNVTRAADHARAAVGVGQGLLALDEGFEEEEKFFGKHG
jgi:hypothetical protein